MTFYIERKYTKRKPSPLVGEGVNRQVDGRGKCEQIRKNRNKYEQNQKQKPPSCLLSGGLLFPEIDLPDYFTL